MMSMSARELHYCLKQEPVAELTDEANAAILRALSLLSSVEDGEGIVRELTEAPAVFNEYGTSIDISGDTLDKAAARITLDAQEKAALQAELASVKAHAEDMADAIQFGDMAILTVAKAAAEAYRAAHPNE